MVCLKWNESPFKPFKESPSSHACHVLRRKGRPKISTEYMANHLGRKISKTKTT